MYRVAGYDITGEIARGGVGVVFRAQDASGRQVAIKLLKGQVSERTRERFLREGRITASLDHPGIVRVHDCGETQGQLYLIYELVEGGMTLEHALQMEEMDRRVQLVEETARALGHAHEHGIVHRDVKPANVLIAASGQVRVADFGLAIGEGDSRLTKTGELLGTPPTWHPNNSRAKWATRPPRPTCGRWGSSSSTKAALQWHSKASACSASQAARAISKPASSAGTLR